MEVVEEDGEEEEVDRKSEGECFAEKRGEEVALSCDEYERGDFRGGSFRKEMGEFFFDEGEKEENAGAA